MRKLWSVVLKECLLLFRDIPGLIILFLMPVLLIFVVTLAQENGLKVVATGNVHYHVRERHQLQDCLVAIRNCRSLEETHRERRPNSEFYLRPEAELKVLFHECPEALSNTFKIFFNGQNSADSIPIRSGVSH